MINEIISSLQEHKQGCSFLELEKSAIDPTGILIGAHKRLYLMGILDTLCKLNYVSLYKDIYFWENR